MNITYMSMLVGFVVVVISIIIIYLWKRRGSQLSTILLVGLSDSGKTALLAKLVNEDAKWRTYTSIKENVFDGYRTSSKKLRLVDYPGVESSRGELFRKWFTKNKKLLKGVIFVIDSSTFTKKIKDVAEFLYDVLFECRDKIPIIVACNKQDASYSKASKLIKNNLEQEFGLINVSREVSLSSTSGDTSRRILSENGKDFQWTDLRNTRIEFLECTTEKDDNFSLAVIKEWLESL